MSSHLLQSLCRSASHQLLTSYNLDVKQQQQQQRMVHDMTQEERKERYGLFAWGSKFNKLYAIVAGITGKRNWMTAFLRASRLLLIGTNGFKLKGDRRCSQLYFDHVMIRRGCRSSTVICVFSIMTLIGDLEEEFIHDRRLGRD